MCMEMTQGCLLEWFFRLIKQQSVNANMLLGLICSVPVRMIHFQLVKTFQALGIHLEEHPTDEAFMSVHAQRTRAHYCYIQQGTFRESSRIFIGVQFEVL
jgi:hypothetical protein|mmetsp:Transcript_1081/g.1977  ORF Transcript_1081/g.1977 Transcript_1081/m.1977 type:complete len:100 (+) Transcript_1081:598-897(+)